MRSAGNARDTSCGPKTREVERLICSFGESANSSVRLADEVDAEWGVDIAALRTRHGYPRVVCRAVGLPNV